MIEVSVVVPTHNPVIERLSRTFEGLKRQTLSTTRWELIVIDNASVDAHSIRLVMPSWHSASHLIREETLGLTYARLRGIDAAAADLIVFVDDDNVLDPSYLAEAIAFMRAHPDVGAAGGRSVPEFETVPPSWVREFDGNLALRDLGAEPVFGVFCAEAPSYPSCAPIGAGMVARTAALREYGVSIREEGTVRITDRKGDSLASSGDNDIVLTILEKGWKVAYSPALSLTHLIPAQRTSVEYLARVARQSYRSWVEVLARHKILLWQPIGIFTFHLRILRAWVRIRPWRSPAARVRFEAARGLFEGRVAVGRFRWNIPSATKCS